MDILVGAIIGLLILTLLVVLHELGHAIAAKSSGVVVEEFGVGFPPSAWKKKLKNGVLLSINWLPLGGFVKLQGEHDSASGRGDYGAASFLQKTKILFAGVAMNWLFAALLFTILAWVGLPDIIQNQFKMHGDSKIVSSPVEVVSLTKGYPAEKSGISVGDKILKIVDQNVTTAEQLIEFTQENRGRQVVIEYEHGGKVRSATVNLRLEAEGGYLGAGVGQHIVTKYTWSAPIVGVATTMQLTSVTSQGLGSLISNLVNGAIMQFSSDNSVRDKAANSLKEVGDSVAGPIGILGVLFPAAQKSGLTQTILLTAVISLTLAVMNILPIPALDGGRWVTIVIFKLTKKELTKEREEKIQSVGFMVLMGLVVLVTLSDVAKLF